MKEIKGKYGTAIVYTNNVDEATIEQVQNIMDSHLSKDLRVRLMPDVHAGAGGPIGLTMTIEDKISPELVGSDIGCGVTLYKFNLNKKIKLDKMDKVIHKNVPAGFNLNSLEKRVKYLDLEHIVNIKNDLKLYKKYNNDMLRIIVISDSIVGGYATLGGGNHFIELYEGEHSDGLFEYYISVHSGSRSIGGQIYKYYRDKSQDFEYNEYLDLREKTIKLLKEENRQKDIFNTLESMKIDFEKSRSSKPIRYLDGDLLNQYIDDVDRLTSYASYSRREMIYNILKNYAKKMHIGEDILNITKISDKPHNYIDRERRVLRKGAQSAEGDPILIPINMRDGMIVGEPIQDDIVREEWNYSSPHGAGRRLSRGEARNQLELETFKEQMVDVYSSTVSEETIDEAPDAYKPIDEILENIKESVKVLKILKPIYNFKGGSEKPDFVKNRGGEE